jgi:DNA polymerase-3 subunit alpha
VATEKTVEYIEECKNLKIPVLPADVNASEAEFSVEGNAIRFALLAVKGAGAKAIEAIVAARKDAPYKSFFDFCERVDQKAVNKAVAEALVAAGAFDGLHKNRAALHAAVEDALRAGALAQEDRKAGQMSLFGEEEAAPSLDNLRLPSIPDWPESERLAREKEALGLYMSGHPLDKHRELLRRLSNTNVKALRDRAEGDSVALGGIIVSVQIRPIKTGKHAGQKMAVVRFEDMTGTVEAVLFSEAYTKFADRLKEDAIVFLRGQVSRRREEPSLVVDEIIDLSHARERLTSKLTLLVSGAAPPETPCRIQTILAKHPGNVPVILEVDTPEFGTVAIRAGDDFRVQVTERLLADLGAAAGVGGIRLN